MGFFPSDLLTSAAVGSYLAAQGAPWIDALPFIGVTLFILAIPSLILLAFGDQGEAFLPKVRGWMETNSWIINEIVLLFFIAITINNLMG